MSTQHHVAQTEGQSPASVATLSHSDFASQIHQSALPTAIKSSILGMIGGSAASAGHDLTVVSGWQTGATIPAGTDVLIAHGAPSGVPAGVPVVVFQHGGTVQVAGGGGAEHVIAIASSNHAVSIGAAHSSIAGSIGGDHLVVSGGHPSMQGSAGHDIVAASNPTVAGSSTLEGGTGYHAVAASATSASAVTTHLSTGHVYNVPQVHGGVVIDTTSSSDHAAIARMYEAVFHRDPSGVELQSLYKSYDASHSLSNVGQSLLAGQHFTSNEHFVDAMYQQLLSRAPATGELQHWTSLLNHGSVSQAKVLADLASSPEAVAKAQGVVHISHDHHLM